MIPTCREHIAGILLKNSAHKRYHDAAHAALEKCSSCVLSVKVGGCPFESALARMFYVKRHVAVKDVLKDWSLLILEASLARSRFIFLFLKNIFKF